MRKRIPKNGPPRRAGEQFAIAQVSAQRTGANLSIDVTRGSRAC